MFFIRLLAFFLFLVVVEAEVVQETGSVGFLGRTGRFTYSYDKDVSDSCESVVMIGVGTAMRSTSYDILGKLISTDNSVVTVFFDHSPGIFIKFFRWRYANFYKAFRKDLAKFLPVCDGKSPKIIIGGHSASGRGGIQAMMHDKNVEKPDGFVGLDAYNLKKEGRWGFLHRRIPRTSVDPDLPVLSWGFKRETCRASLDVSGRALYELSGEENRVFFRADNVDKEGRVGHCAFTDNGCSALLPNCPQPANNNVKEVVAESIQIFVRSVTEGSIKPADFKSLANEKFDVFVNSDAVEDSDPAAQTTAEE